MKFSIKDFFSKCNQICRKLRIWSHLLKRSSMENFIFLSRVGDKIDRSFNEVNIERTMHPHCQTSSLRSSLSFNLRSNRWGNLRSNWRANLRLNLRSTFRSNLRLILKLNRWLNRRLSLKSNKSNKINIKIE